MPVKIIIIVIVLIIVFIALNYLAYKLIIYNVQRRYINPFLKSEKMTLQRIKCTGLFDKGYFGRDKLVLLPVSELGKLTTATYVHIYVITKENRNECYTVKILCRFLFVYKVFLRTGRGEKYELKLIRESYG
ncbi:hypothetical protein [Pedobacter nototheniae]|uniref:hypothetical protein n=1 Tax=Pedobacter nototheniae TaxID=2488994 RepID=UPI0010406CFC|nr:hypothetical protein [Pedobacter nototheniae]